ncbi:MAG: sulfate reduction electron transfer complex DsrMKJOP subunit DsrP [Planctomycetota bacterium]
MIEKALTGSRRYWTLLTVFGGLVFIGLLCYLRQYHAGLQVTGLSRDVTWGFYIAQFTFLVGVAASAVMVVLPYYLHNYKAFGKLAVLGEFLAISAVIMCMLFIFVDMGKPTRVLNVMLYPSPNSLMFWDMVSLMGYLLLNILISRVTFAAERKSIAPPSWIRFFVVLSIPWAVSIHTVTAFLYSGLGARPFWMTAIMAPRFLATAFAAGPALLILLSLLLKQLKLFDPGKEAVKKLAVIITYAMAANIFFLLMEIFTATYSAIPGHVDHLKLLYVGLDGNTTLVPWMWLSSIFSVIAMTLLFVPKWRERKGLLVAACFMVFFGIYFEKGLGMVVAGFIPTTMHTVVDYVPSGTELGISIGIYGLGALILTILYKVAVTVRRREPEAAWAEERPENKEEVAVAAAAGD